MWTRSRTNAKATRCRQYRQWTEKEKTWIQFSDLYSCISEDPLQVYMKYHLGMTPKNVFEQSFIASSSRGKQDDQKALFFKTHETTLFFVSENMNAFRHSVVEQKMLNLARPLENFFSVPIVNDRARLKMMVDMIATSAFLHHLDPSVVSKDTSKSSIVFFTSSEKPTTYQYYKLFFAQRILARHASRIDLEDAYFYNLNTLTLMHVDLTKDKFKKYAGNISKYCRWIRNCIHYGSEYTLLPPSHPFLYPNMKVDCGDVDMQAWKMTYAQKLDEMTLLWKCHPKHRQRLHDKQIFSFTDTRFRVEDLQLQSKTDETMLKDMLALRVSDKEQIRMPPDAVDFSRTSSHHLFVDFETLDDMIYWIGVGVWDGTKYEYRAFVSHNVSVSDELDVMTSFSKWLEGFPQKTVYYWFAEERFWNRARKQHTDAPDMDFSCWVDLCKLFSTTPILVKNCFNFKLKTIAKEMKRMDMIDIVVPQECSSGQDSLVLARRYFEKRLSADYESLWKYNYFDCRVMFEIVYFLGNGEKCKTV